MARIDEGPKGKVVERGPTPTTLLKGKSERITTERRRNLEK